MTTFNDILGVLPQDPAAKVKQRYKLLSIRVHPDKGGSKALMQLVCHAYENITKGKGDHAIHLPSTIFEKERMNKELIHLRRERDELLSHNKELKRRVKKNADDASDLHYSRKISLLEGELFLLKEERFRYKHQKDELIVEQRKLVIELRSALSENEVLETQVNQRLGFQYPKTSVRFHRPLAAMIVFLFLCIPIVLSLKAIGWKNLLDVGTSKEKEAARPDPRVVYPNLTQAQEQDVKAVFEGEMEKTEASFLEPFLQLNDNAGIWSVASYVGTKKPYIAIRSDNGSYVVNDCSGDFTFYLNQRYKPLRVAANLIYSHQNQDFHVYKIPYGQGSSPESWLQSRKLRINDEYFTSELFGMSRADLVRHCLISES